MASLAARTALPDLNVSTVADVTALPIVMIDHTVFGHVNIRGLSDVVEHRSLVTGGRKEEQLHCCYETKSPQFSHEAHDGLTQPSQKEKEEQSQQQVPEHVKCPCPGEFRATNVLDKGP